jgi:hypothetical protein
LLASPRHLPRVLPAVERVAVAMRLAAVHLDVVVAEDKAVGVEAALLVEGVV